MMTSGDHHCLNDRQSRLILIKRHTGTKLSAFLPLNQKFFFPMQMNSGTNSYLLNRFHQIVSSTYLGEVVLHLKRNNCLTGIPCFLLFSRLYTKIFSVISLSSNRVRVVYSPSIPFFLLSISGLCFLTCLARRK